jgi:hypothetical protein
LKKVGAGAFWIGFYISSIVLIGYIHTNPFLVGQFLSVAGSLESTRGQGPSPASPNAGVDRERPVDLGGKGYIQGLIDRRSPGAS